MTNSNIGTTNEFKAMASYSGRGYDIFIPMGNTRADFIAVKGNKVVKVQVKTAATRRYKAADTKYTLAVLTTTRNGVVSTYTAEDVDEFFVIGKTMAWGIPVEEVEGRKTVMLESTVENYVPRHGMNVNEWRVAL